MANFKAWKIYMLHLIDELVEEHGLRGPFIDAGCGSGDVSAHFAQKGWSGTAVDFSPEAISTAREALREHTNVRVSEGDLFSMDLATANTIFLMDVIEHVKDDEAFLRGLAQRLTPGGHVVVTVPVNPEEWRWDDDFYGHYRRYIVQDFHSLVERCGLKVVASRDCSFPLFWFMRRVYTRLFRKTGTLSGAPEDRTRVSTQRSAWDFSPLSSWIDRFFLATRLYMIHYPFRKGRWGCEQLLVARKEPTSV